jgi:hypothetical protein
LGAGLARTGILSAGPNTWQCVSHVPGGNLNLGLLRLNVRRGDMIGQSLVKGAGVIALGMALSSALRHPSTL